MPAEVVQFHAPSHTPTRLTRPIFTCPVSAGEPRPVVEYIDERIDLNKH
jgi:hypothetical protein